MSIEEKIYIVGHKKPDLDSIASALGYQTYRNSQGDFNYYAIRCDKISPLTEWVFNKFETRLPEYIPNISGMNIVLVDHTYPESRPKGWEKAKILEVIDHHDVKLEDILPKRITIRQCGSTSSLIAEMMFVSNMKIPFNIAGILLSAILDDTLNLESPTTKDLDMDMAYRLAHICSIEDTDEFAREIFTKKDIWNEMNAKEIIEMDIKEVEIKGNRVSISQVETIENRGIRLDEIIEELKSLNKKEPINLRIVMITDLVKKECNLLVVGSDIVLFENVLGERIVNYMVYLPNVVSRKKQILPIIEKMYS